MPDILRLGIQGNDTKPTGQGTGLGLSLSYDIIKSFGGSFILDPETNDATRFIISLPVSLNTK